MESIVYRDAGAKSTKPPTQTTQSVKACRGGATLLRAALEHAVIRADVESEDPGGLEMIVALCVVGGLVLLLLAASLAAYLTLAVPAMKKAPALSAEDLEACRKVVAAGKGYPWVCRRALKTGTCPCQPCSKLASAKPH
jgi:hypothetical protein